MVDSPDVQPQLRNRTVASLGFVWVGDPDEGRQLVPLVTGLGAPLAERVEKLSYLSLQTMDDEWHRPGARRRYFKGHYLSELSDAAVDAFLSQGEPDADADRVRLPNGSRKVMAGDRRDVEDDDSAFSHRNTLVEFVAATGWTDPAEDDERGGGPPVRRRRRAVRKRRLRQRAGRRGETGVRRAYPAGKSARLATLKRRYDPDNVFHLNQNIRPSGDRRYLCAT